MNYDDSWVYLNKFIDQKIDAALTQQKIYFVEVVKTDGYFIDASIYRERSTTAVLKNIPIVQSKYNSPIIQKGDLGLLINMHQDISSILDGFSTGKTYGNDYYIFLPLITRMQFKGLPDNHTLSSPDLQTSIVIDDDGIVVTIVKAYSLAAETVDIATVEAVTTTCKNYNLTVEEAITKTCKSESLTAEETIELNASDTNITSNVAITGDVAVEGSNIAIKGSAPIEFGTSETLGAVLGELCSALLGFMTTPTAPGAPAAADPGFVAKVNVVNTKLKQVLK